MDNYITGATVRRLREEKGITQAQLAEQIGVSSKAVSKWETAKGLPDITLIEPLAKALGVSVMELMSGNTVINKNISSNILRSQFYVCPLCGNIIRSTGETVVSCCGITLPALEAEEVDELHEITVEKVEDEHFITVSHEMTKTHFISFVAYLTSDRVQFVKLYPEGNAETRMQLRGRGYIYIYCNKHGLMKKKCNRNRTSIDMHPKSQTLPGCIFLCQKRTKAKRYKVLFCEQILDLYIIKCKNSPPIARWGFRSSRSFNFFISAIAACVAVSKVGK